VVPDIDICNYNLLDLNDDNSVTKEELDILIQSTGRVELEELYESLDQNNDGIVAQEEYMKLYEDICNGDLEGADTQQKDE
ncbi:protein S100-G-like, partial [Saccostrea cucullata]